MLAVFVHTGRCTQIRHVVLPMRRDLQSDTALPMHADGVSIKVICNVCDGEYVNEIPDLIALVIILVVA